MSYKCLFVLKMGLSYSATYNSLYGVQLGSTNFRQDFRELHAETADTAEIHSIKTTKN